MEGNSSTSLKRQREETQVVEVQQQQQEEVSKRQKSYKDIITLLEEEEDVPNEDLSSLISTLQEEISPSGSDPVQSGSNESDPILSESGSGGEEEEGEKVMRHLLEASDDELGIPNNSSTVTNYSSTEMDGLDALFSVQVDGGDLFSPVGGEGLWEFEDYEAANYYDNLLQTEIFM